MGGPEEAMNWHRWLVTLLVMLALAPVLVAALST